MSEARNGNKPSRTREENSSPSHYPSSLARSDFKHERVKRRRVVEWNRQIDNLMNLMIATTEKGNRESVEQLELLKARWDMMKHAPFPVGDETLLLGWATDIIQHATQVFQTALEENDNLEKRLRATDQQQQNGSHTAHSANSASFSQKRHGTDEVFPAHFQQRSDLSRRSFLAKAPPQFSPVIQQLQQSIPSVKAGIGSDIATDSQQEQQLLRHQLAHVPSPLHTLVRNNTSTSAAALGMNLMDLSQSNVAALLGHDMLRNTGRENEMLRLAERQRQRQELLLMASLDPAATIAVPHQRQTIRKLATTVGATNQTSSAEKQQQHEAIAAAILLQHCKGKK